MPEPRNRGDDVKQLIPTKQAMRDPDAAARTLQDWWHATLGDATLQVVGVTLPQGAGVANETLMVDTVRTIDGRTAPQSYVVRVDAADHLYMDMNLRAHYDMYRTVADVSTVPVPKTVAFEEARSVLGEPFFVMEKVEGLVPSDNPNYHAQGWVTELSVGEREAMWHNTVAAMVGLQQIAPQHVAFLERPHLGSTGLEQELNYWLKYARWAGAQSHPVVQGSAEWLQKHLPQDAPRGLSWGDARPANVMYRGTEPVALFDWDMVSLAGPEADLAWWTIMDQADTKVHRRLPGLGTPQQTVELWEELFGRRAENLHWHLVLAAFRLSTIMLRLPEMLVDAGLMTDEVRQSFRNNTGVQWLVSLLDLPWDQPVTERFEGWDK